MWIPCLVIAFILCFIAAVLNEENAPSLISGINTMPVEKHKNIDFKGLVRHFKRSTYTLSAALVFIAFLEIWVKDERLLAILITIVTTIGMLHLMFFGGKYDKNPVNKFTKLLMIAVGIGLVVGALVIMYDIYQTPIEQWNSRT